MKKSVIYALSLLLISGTVTFTACKKKSSPAPEPTPAPAPVDNEQTTASDNSYAESSSDDIASMGSQISENNGLTTFKTTGGASSTELQLAPCATITAAAKIFTVDFGTTGCTGLDGKVRTGKLIYDFTASTNSATAYRMPGFKFSVSSSNYVVDGYTINITNKTIQNTTPLSVTGETVYSGTNLTWSVSANISIAKPNNAGTITWSCNRTRELINSNDPTCYKGQLQAIDWTKAKVKLNGSASGTTAGSESFSATATNLVRDFTCAPDPNHPHHHPFISGTIDFTPGNHLTRHIDYGNGSCDFNATLTLGNNTYTITLP